MEDELLNRLRHSLDMTLLNGCYKDEHVAELMATAAKVLVDTFSYNDEVIESIANHKFIKACEKLLF